MSWVATDGGTASPLERARLVGLCRRLTGDPGVAEDLAQETLIEAWRHTDRLRDREARWPWLAAIARNVCARWARRRGRELARRAVPALRDDVRPSLDDAVAAEDDLEVELERSELAELLDRALALLPADARAVLIARYVEESSVAEIAGRLGLTEGAVAMRLQRGKLTLKRVLLTTFREQAASYGLVEADAWQTTRIWCSFCGGHRLEARFLEGREVLLLRCRCGYSTDARQAPTTGFGWTDLKGYRASLSRMMEWHRLNHLPALATGLAPCVVCARPTPLTVEPFSESTHVRLRVGTLCAACGAVARESHEWLMLCLPEARRFWREHPRIRFAGTRSVEAQGLPALVTAHESVDGGARIEVVAAADTLRILSVHRR